ncbi:MULTISPECIES: cysteine hydrolase [unclassified Pseudomonas]|uniref:cysteine hydrolase n=1 Tax=unclassified Pseudomonas TaxID=196821 RepID=UPI002AC9A9B3|nr:MULTISPECIES: cysteine hydrolase [unclassified Pseudomonas]MEB0043346.1 cysteine hydrolase [Pseudomonas sp. MH10]MEB0122930.1 cysteine hydrolase [Pseudomonas sp. CCI1.2]WPX64050.1 cysteine hydrolase [Pseudomonas sp. MH10]
MKALIVIDIQREYISTGRSFHIGSIGPSLQNAYLMLQHARKEGWPIVHVQHLQDGNLFNAASDTSDFIDGFVPEGGETHAIKGNYSSFSSPDFVDFVKQHADHEFVVIGYGTTMCCLSTIVEGYHRGYRFALVEDASAALAAEGKSEASMHQHAAAILKPFARVTSTERETGCFAVMS